MAELKEIFNKIDQIGVVVKDLEKAKAGMKELFGVEPDVADVFNYKDRVYRGEKGDCSVDVLLYDFLGLQLEFMTPRSGESAWQDFINEGKEGLHHIRFDVADHEAAIQAMAEKGIKVYQAGDSVRGGGVKYAYFDTVPSLGFIIETLNLREVAKK
ncbi:MAG: VOC family protein [Syntrophomonadaceae bacterium]|jgi:methylmalonyl-CoA/ethylmalonyl-CoA epimerase